jgi:hypothetical protein
MSKYLNGKIYKIVNSIDDEVYVGSTIKELHERWNSHKAACKRLTGRVYKHLNKIGIEHARIELIENFPCSSKHELLSRERHYIDLIATLNQYKTGSKYDYDPSVYKQRSVTIYTANNVFNLIYTDNPYFNSIINKIPLADDHRHSKWVKSIIYEGNNHISRAKEYTIVGELP